MLTLEQMGGGARWRHGGNKAEHVPRAAEPDVPVSFDSPGVARPGEGRLRVIGNAEVPAIPNVPALPDDAQPMARLRDCLGMHDRAYPPRVMRALREQMEKKPKNVSFSEDNGHWMPQGSRFEFKVCPRTRLYQRTGDTGGAVSGLGLSGRQVTSPGRGSGMRMKKASLRVTFIFGHRMGDQFWHACTSVRQRLTKLRSMQALVMSSQEGSTQLGS